MQKLLAIAACLTLSIFLVGCGEPKKPAAAPTKTGAAAATGSPATTAAPATTEKKGS